MNEKNPHQVRREILHSLEQRPEMQVYRLGRQMGELLQQPQRNLEAIRRNIEAARALGVLIDLEDVL